MTANEGQAPWAGTRVLVADDDPQILAMVAQALRALDLDVTEASEGDKALALAREHKPRLVVLDVMMPGMSGWEVCRAIREDEHLEHTSVLMLTGIGERLNDMTSPLYGADDHLDKPFDLDALHAKVKEILS
ncbi:MAG: response regulator transcription factor [Polyangiales bacterium]